MFVLFITLEYDFYNIGIFVGSAYRIVPIPDLEIYRSAT